MEKETNCASDSDSSDEDFCPDDANAANDELSEESSDDEIEDDIQTEAKPTTSKRINLKKVKAKTGKTKENYDNIDCESKRTTRQSDDAGKFEKHQKEKDELESDDDEKERANALWADFLGDVKEMPTEIKKSATTSPKENVRNVKKSTCTTISAESTYCDNAKRSEENEAVPSQTTITEVLEFAGEEIHLQKTVKTDSIKENKAVPLNNGSSTLGIKRSAASSSGAGGLGSILNNIGKKKKISVLEKSKLDWNSFKKDEGIEEELQTFNKGKDGYLERQDFLERTDHRQFEIERNLRQTRRNH